LKKYNREPFRAEKNSIGLRLKKIHRNPVKKNKADPFSEQRSQTPFNIPANRSTIPLVHAIAADLPLPGVEIEERFVRMIGTDKLGRAAESLEPDGILPASVTFHAFSHGNQTFLFPALTSFSRTELRPGPHPPARRCLSATISSDVRY
jgi:hypothetical protein